MLMYFGPGVAVLGVLSHVPLVIRYLLKLPFKKVCCREQHVCHSVQTLQHVLHARSLVCHGDYLLEAN